MATSDIEFANDIRNVCTKHQRLCILIYQDIEKGSSSYWANIDIVSSAKILDLSLKLLKKTEAYRTELLNQHLTKGLNQSLERKQ